MIDFFPKVEDSLSERTLGGALVSVLSVAFVLWAGTHELAECMKVGRVDRLVPHTSAEHGNLLSINLDLHFPALPCSELAIQVRDSTGAEDLKSRDTVSKLRTTASGEAIGMPERLEFTERVALGMRLHRFMHVLSDVLALLLRFSLRSGCERNYTVPCPDHWEDLGHGRCQAPFWYFGHCNHISIFTGYTAADKEDWSLGCQANWPCLPHVHVRPELAHPDAAHAHEMGIPNATTLRDGLEQLTAILEREIVTGGDDGIDDEHPSLVEQQLLRQQRQREAGEVEERPPPWVARRLVRLAEAERELHMLTGALHDSSQPGGHVGDVALLGVEAQKHIEAALRQLTMELEWERHLAHEATTAAAAAAVAAGAGVAAATGAGAGGGKGGGGDNSSSSNGTASVAGGNGTADGSAIAAAAAGVRRGERPDAATVERRSEKVRASKRTLEKQLIAPVERRGTERALATQERLAGYAGLQANLSAVMAEVEELSPDKTHRQRLTATLRGMVSQLQRLRDGAAGEERQQLELSVEEAGDGLLRSLKVMRDGQQGEGCSLFGTVEVPRVSGQLRIVPSSADGGRVAAGFGDEGRPKSGFGSLPDYNVRHALYFNVSHVLRHLSFGPYVPGMSNPLDSSSVISQEGAAEAKYMLKVVPCTYAALNGTITYSNLYSVTEHFHPLHWHSGQHLMPGIFFAYDISGMKVSFTEQRGASLTGAIARVCALVGGVMTVASIIDKIIYQSSAVLVKGRMGKQG